MSMRDLACLVQTNEAAEALTSHWDIFEVASADIAIINAKKHRKEVLEIFKPNSGPSSTCFKKYRFKIEGSIGKTSNFGEHRKLILISDDEKHWTG